jgi:dimethylamine/trimethylamine dehydrogenase
VTDNAVYLETLLKYYEDEVMGEAYFYGLADHIGGTIEREKLALLAKVERRAADVVQPLLEKYGLVPRDESVLKILGEAHVERHRHYSWMELMAYMTDRYPAYLDEFEALERLAPEDDMPALKLLTHHEVVAIDFADKEIAGDSDSLASVREYLDHCTA